MPRRDPIRDGGRSEIMPSPKMKKLMLDSFGAPEFFARISARANNLKKCWAQSSSADGRFIFRIQVPAD
ncbi:MAG TPA: hypothetical protein VM943_10910 [Pyrinomonadaceae bacterium]|nr:hypothetical protein [Pyrinomonadaceae bacterium]